MVKVMIVEDSRVVLELLHYILSADPDIQIAAVANSGEEALAQLKKFKPDVITMDIVMPGMSGLETIQEIMRTDPIPIVIVSSAWRPSEVNNTFLALETGAVAFLEKPRGLGSADSESFSLEIRQKVKLMAGVKVIKRMGTNSASSREPCRLPNSLQPGPGIVCVGASTGGPQVIASILSELVRPFPLPVLIVQHIAAGFVSGMAAWLKSTTGFEVAPAIDGETIRPGRIYLAQDGRHLGLATKNKIELSDSAVENGMKPSVSYLFRSIEKVYKAEAIAVLLSGMGKDGAAELRSLREAGAVTIAQDKESSIVHGMPGEAIRIDGAKHILDPSGIARFLNLVRPPVNGFLRKEMS